MNVTIDTEEAERDLSATKYFHYTFNSDYLHIIKVFCYQTVILCLATINLCMVSSSACDLSFHLKKTSIALKTISCESLDRVPS